MKNLVNRIKNKAIVKATNYIICTFRFDPLTMNKINIDETLVKLGSHYGGWVIPEHILNDKSICYCVGCGEDISFDLKLIDNYKCNVYGFDPTPKSIVFVKKLTKQTPNYHFFEFGVWSKDTTIKLFSPKNPDHASYSALNIQNTDTSIEVEVKCLTSIMSMLGHNKLDLLKIDIEGAEYEVIKSICTHQPNIGVICIEFDECHHPIDRHYRARIQESVKNLLDIGYQLIYCDRNGNYSFKKSRQNYDY